MFERRITSGEEERLRAWLLSSTSEEVSDDYVGCKQCTEIVNGLLVGKPQDRSQLIPQLLKQHRLYDRHTSNSTGLKTSDPATRRPS
jgi:hypothetical protein